MLGINTTRGGRHLPPWLRVLPGGVDVSAAPRVPLLQEAAEQAAAPERPTNDQLLELQLTNMTAQQRRLTEFVLAELRLTRADNARLREPVVREPATGEVAATLAAKPEECSRCMQVMRVFELDEQRRAELQALDEELRGVQARVRRCLGNG